MEGEFLDRVAEHIVEGELLVQVRAPAGATLFYSSLEKGAKEAAP